MAGNRKDSSRKGFETILIEIEQEMSTKDIKNLAFLSEMTKTPKNGREVFQYLKQRLLLRENNVSCLSTMLKFVGRVDLCTKLENYSGVSADVDTKQYFSPFLGMLLNLSESLNDEEIDRIKFIVKISSDEKFKHGTDLFVEMLQRFEHEFIQNLKEALKCVNRQDLLKKLEGYLESPEYLESLEYLQSRFRNLHVARSTPDSSVPNLSEKPYVTEESNSLNALLPDVPDDVVGARIQQPGLESDQIKHYDMSSTPRGFCVIINQKKFKNDIFPERKGTDVDKAKIIDCFQNLQFEPKEYDDRSEHVIMSIFEEISTNGNLQNHDAFFCFILSHGCNDTFYCTNGNEIDTHKIESFFTADKCQNLANKPKVFFYVCCQEAVKTTLEADGGEAPQYVHPEADFLRCYATVPNGTSWRDPTYGTWYISDLIKTIEEYHQSEDLLSMLTIASKKTSDRKYEESNMICTQQPRISHTLRHKIKL